MLNSNELKVNEWNIKRFIIFVLSIHLAIWGLVSFEEIGFKIHLIRHIIGFFYIAFLPGIIILRILKLTELCTTEVLLYSVGLSISFSMFIGFIMNFLFPLFDISNPISLKYLLATISLVLLTLTFICYQIDKGKYKSSIGCSEDFLSLPTLFFCLLPILAVLGTYSVNYYHNNILLMVLIIFVALIVILVGFYDFIPENLYPLAIFSISISLLFHNSLVSMYLFGWDIQVEYYFSNLVFNSSIWNQAIPSASNSVLSISIFTPIISIISGLDIIWSFKIIFPILFSFVPVGLFQILKKQTNHKIAFFSTFFFMSLVVYYTDMLHLIRQQVAELFLTLIILLLFEMKITKSKKSFLLIVFTFSLIVSHYGLSYIFMFSIFFAYFLMHFCAKYTHNKNETNKISFNFLLLYVVFVCSWYMYISNSSVFDIFVTIIKNILINLYDDFLNPEAAQGLGMLLQKKSTYLDTIYKYIQILFQVFISVGLLTSLFKLGDFGVTQSNKNKESQRFDFKSLAVSYNTKSEDFQCAGSPTLYYESTYFKFETEYKVFSIIFYMLLIAAIIIPYLAIALNTSRIYHISLLFLAPYCVLGGMKIIQTIFFKCRKAKNPNEKSLKVLSILFAIFLLFNCGLIHKVTNNPVQMSISLSDMDFPKFNEKEFCAAKWLYYTNNNHSQIYADEFRRLLLVAFFEGLQITKPILEPLSYSTLDINSGSYIYMGTLNVLKNQLLIANRENVVRTYEYIDSKTIIDGTNKIYDGGEAMIYKSL